MLRYLLIGWLLLSGPVRAQLAHSLRLELNTNPSGEESFDVLPLAERGLLITTQRGASYGSGAANFQFQRLDTNLKTLWTSDYKQNNRYEPAMSYHNEQYQYWLFREPEGDDIQVLRVGLDDGLVETFDGKLLSLMDIQQFKVMDNTAYIGGYYHNRPVVMQFSFFDRTSRVLPGLYVNHLEINDIELDERRGEVHVLVHAPRRRCQFSLRSYGRDGKLRRTVDFDGSRYSLISGKLLPINEEESLLIGNYSADCTPYSQGIYVTRIRHDESMTAEAATRNIRYIEFSQLENFFNYLKPRRQERIMAKVSEKKNQGKDYKFRYRLLVHDLMPTDDGLTLIAEVYYPQYRGTNMPFYNGLLRSYDRYFEGYRYTHAFVCGFDRQGNLLWDNCLPIKNLDSPELTRLVQVSRQGDAMVLAYPQDGAINTEVIVRNRTLQEGGTYKLETNSETERVLYSAEDNLAAWYGNHFLACGFQKIAADGSTRERDVFYINKLTYSAEAAQQPPTDTLPKSSRASRKEADSGH